MARSGNDNHAIAPVIAAPIADVFVNDEGGLGLMGGSSG